MADVKEVTGDGSGGQELLGDDPTPQKDPTIPLETTDEVEEIEETPEEIEEEEVVEEEAEEEAEEEVEEEPEVKLSPRDEDIVKKLNEKDKTILKEFPQIRSALFEQKEFRKLGTVDDAKEAFERSEILDAFEDIVVAGDAGSFITTVAQENAEGFAKFSENFLPALFEKNPVLYDKVVTPLARNMLSEALKQAKASNNLNLERSVAHLSQFLFNSPTVPQTQPKAPEDEKLQRERLEFNQKRASTFRTETQTSSITVMTAKIEKMVPKEVVGALRKVVVDSVLKGIGAQLNKDEYYRRQIDSLYRKADRSNYAGDWGPRIRGVYLGHATKLLPAVLGLVSKELLGNRATTPKPKPKVKVETQNSSPAAKDVFKVDPKTGKKMTDLEFLAS